MNFLFPEGNFGRKYLKMVMSNLTKREMEIVEMIIEEKSSWQISKALGISTKTVESHRKNIYLKTGSKTVVGLVKKFMLKQL